MGSSQENDNNSRYVSDTAKILDEDLWGLAGIWKALPMATSDSITTTVFNMSAVGIAID
jgi:hypothetical protein